MVKTNNLFTIQEIVKTRDRLNNVSGIYIVYFRDLCLYVGATKNLRNRVTPFITKNGFSNKGLEYFINYCPYSDLKIRIIKKEFSLLKQSEQVYIDKNRPIFNWKNKLYKYLLIK